MYAVDHHRGSEEHQLGEEYHDPDLYDSSVELMDSFKAFRSTMRKAGLEDTVGDLLWPVQRSRPAPGHDPIGHGLYRRGGTAKRRLKPDYRSWVSHITPGGILAIHDIFPNPADGGQAPYNIWKLAKASGLFDELPMVNTLGLFRRK